MISIIGLGNSGTKIAEKFSKLSQYNIFCLNNSVKRTSKYKFKLKSYETPEEYEQNVPNVRKFFKDVDNDIQFFVVGASYSSNYALGILEQIRDKKIDLYYVKPDTDLLAGIPKLMENATFGVLQEYARSGLFNSINLISNLNLENIIQDVPVKEYYNTLNDMIQSTVHYMNYFEHNEPEIGVLTKPAEICRIATYGVLNMKNLEEKWFFDLDIDREVCYYMCMNKEKLEKDGGLHRRLVQMLKEKPRNAFRKISYAIYETETGNDFGFCVARTNVVQKTLDKLEQE
tara:strand:- start:3018 stop:3878 length:861 start_codon:yes stop_codon:yes gene_type:complete